MSALVAAGLVFFGLSQQDNGSQALSARPGSPTSLSLTSGTHAVSWRGEAHRRQPTLDELEITAVDHAHGYVAQVQSESSFYCDGNGTCSLGSLLVPATGTYTVTVTVRALDPTGHLAIAQDSGPTTHARSPSTALLGISLLGLSAVGALLVLRRRRAPRVPSG